MSDFFSGEMVMEMLRQLLAISRKSCVYKSTAESLMYSFEQILPIIEEIQHSGVELSKFRQFQLDQFSNLLHNGLDLANRVLSSARWNLYKNLMLVRTMDKFERDVTSFVQGPLQFHVIAVVLHLRFDTVERLDRLERLLERIEEGLRIRLAAGGVGGGDKEGGGGGGGGDVSNIDNVPLQML